MVEDVLTVVRDTENEAEGIIKKAKDRVADILGRGESDARGIAEGLEKEGKTQAEGIIKKARVEGEKEAAEIIEAERKKAEKLEKASQKNLEKGVKLIVDSVLSLGGK